MSETPVTGAQYQAVTGTNASWASATGSPWSSRAPVEFVSWQQAQQFCQTMSKRLNLHVRLPTEAEWEYACRAGTTTAFNTGDKLLRNMADYWWDCTYPSNRIDEEAEEIPAWHERRLLPADGFKPNGWGLYDMHGGVSQWCSDWFGAYERGEVVDPHGPDTGTERVTRGGSWHSAVNKCRSASRGHAIPETKTQTIGFRVVLETSFVNREAHRE